MNDSNPSEPAARERAASVTLSRTWELELFISGATVFALLRAPGMVDAWWARTEPHLADGVSMAGFLGFYYAKLILYTLISTFIVHLVARAYWVGLVGLHSVYPQGVRWDELGYGPAFLDAFRRRLPSLEHAIRRMDDVSSLLYSGGAVILLLFFSSVVLFVLFAVVAVAIGRLFFDGAHSSTMLIGATALVAAIPMLAKAIDLRLARREPERRPGAALRALAVASYWFTLTPLVGSMSLVLASNLGRRTAAAATAIVMSLIVGTFVVRDVLLGSGMMRVDNHLYLPDHRAPLEQSPAYYANNRAPGQVHPASPAIQGEIIQEPYVRLFIPVTPQSHNPLIRERCGDVPRFRSGLRMVNRGAPDTPPDVAPLLRCLAALQPVTLDGAPIPLEYRLATEAATGLRGIVAFIPVAGLAPGEHVLRVEALPRAAGTRVQRPRAGHVIRFWL